jgi:hypothetical protein
MSKSSNNAKKTRKTTVELPAVAPETKPLSTGTEESASPDDALAGAPPVDPEPSRVTHELEAIATPADDAGGEAASDSPAALSAPEEQESGPSAEMSGPVASARLDDGEHTEAFGDDDATVIRPSVEPPQAERPRHHTLSAIARPRGTTDPNGQQPPQQQSRYTDSAEVDEIADVADEIPDETEGVRGDEREWALADQPTVSLSPGSVLGARPQYLETDEHTAWPPHHAFELPAAESLSEAAASLRRRAIPRPDRTGQQRYASPDGRRIPPTPPGGIPRSAFQDPRMERYRELARRRDAVDGEGAAEGEKPVTDRVRQWWGDLRPGLAKALDYQHEARASGVHPVPASDGPGASRLSDVFGRLTASARGLTERAQSAAGPAFKRIHDQAEHAAQAIVDRFEGDTARQQAPFLGPGRIAVFFRSGVSVGQAQRLLSSNDARPLRIIPRKHGFLAYVLPGTEEQTSRRLQVHPYVRDVLFIAFDAYGDPVEHADH